MDFSLIVIGADSNWWLQLSSWWAIIQVVLGLGMVIFVHELGHFLVAKACGVKCEKFYVGFDVPIKIFGRQILPAALFRKQIGETEYGIGMVPFGGYVKMLGQDDNPGNIEQEIKRSRGESEVDGQAESAGYVDKNELDPRSYRAKTVPQRMAIISAGVVFNLMFAVLFAALAFRAGVDYEPAAIGSVMGGGPAWEANLAGAQLTRVGEETVSEDRYFTFIDMAQEVAFADDGNITLEVKREGSDELEAVEIQTRKKMSRDSPDLPRIGVERPLVPIVGSDEPVIGHAAVNAKPALKKGDVILEVNGVKITSLPSLREQMFLSAQDEVELLIGRAAEGSDSESKEQIKVSIGKNPVRNIGFGIQWGTVEGIQVGSPAEGVFQKGDEIVSVSDMEDVSPLTFDYEVGNRLDAGDDIDFLIKRGGEEMTVSVSPVASKSMSLVGPIGLLALDTVGIAVKVSDRVANVASGSKLAQAGIKDGDQIVSVTYLLAEEHRGLKCFSKLHEKKVELENTSIAEIYRGIVQQLPTGTEFQIDFKDGPNTKTVTVASQNSDRLFLPTRGFKLTGKKSHYQSATWSDAFSNGYNQVWNDAGRVWKFLTKLVTGKLSVKNLGGPGLIAVAATSEASQGTGRLLLFLTLLSANLAIVNFLPIPVLDGGHMVFLAYEGLFRRPVSEKVEILLTWGGLFFILGLMIFVTSMDAMRITKLFF